MHKLLLIDDSECSDALNNFLQDNQKDILLLMDEEEFNQRIEKIINDLKHLYKMQRKMVVKLPDGIKKISIADIMYVKKLQKPRQALFYQKDNKELLVLSDMQTIENDLTDFNFVRVNDDYLLNADFLCQFIQDDEKHVLMENGQKIQVDADKESVLLELLNNWK